MRNSEWGTGPMLNAECGVRNKKAESSKLTTFFVFSLLSCFRDNCFIF